MSIDLSTKTRQVILINPNQDLVSKKPKKSVEDIDSTTVNICNEKTLLITKRLLRKPVNGKRTAIVKEEKYLARVGDNNKLHAIKIHTSSEDSFKFLGILNRKNIVNSMINDSLSTENDMAVVAKKSDQDKWLEVYNVLRSSDHLLDHDTDKIIEGKDVNLYEACCRI